MDYSGPRLALQEPAVNAGHVAFLAMVDGLESLVAASPIDLAPDAGRLTNSFNQAPLQPGANRLLMSESCHHFTFKFHEIHGYHCYRNEYQTALDRILPEVTATHGFLEKPQKKTAKTGHKCPIPTLASMFCCMSSKELGKPERPLSVKLSVKWPVQILLATTRQNSLKLAHHSLTRVSRTGSRFMTTKGNVMKQRFILFRRSGVFYYEDTTTGKQLSLRTKDEAEAQTLLNAKNESFRQPVLNRQIARTYLAATDSEMASRTWQTPMDEMTKTKTGSTHARHVVAMKDKAFDLIRNLPILETHSAHFLKVLEAGKVSTNVYLRRIHNFALDMNWLPWPILPKRQWPQVRFKEKRAITLEEHQKIVAAEVNPERKMLYQLCWHLGASQSDIANLNGEDVDWTNGTVSFIRQKTGVPVLVHLGAEGLSLFKDLPAEGILFPYLASVRAGDRATEFASRCRQLGIKGVTLHSYRYAWAERAKVAGMPERFAQEALGHNSKAVHRAYAKRALVKIPSLEEYEQKRTVCRHQSS